MGRLLNRAPSTVCNWCNTETFPTRFYFVMTALLLDLGYTAPRSLWKFEDTKRRVA